MYCPGCGAEDNGSNLFCRSCGGDLKAVRSALSPPDAITDSAVSARRDIGRAYADRIRSSITQDLAELTDEILPEVEKFLESPEERRLRRMRRGSMTAFVGLGMTMAFAFLALAVGEAKLASLAAFGLIAFFVGVAIFVNGYFLTVPKREYTSLNENDGEKTKLVDPPETNELLMPPSARQEFNSVVEGTTRHLDRKKADAGGQD